MKRFHALIGFVLLCAALFFLPPPFVQSVKNVYFQITKPFHSALRGGADGALWVFRVPQLARENKLLKIKLDNFKRLSFEKEELEIENARLRALLGYKTRLSTSVKKAIPCQVIGRSPGGWRETILLDRGREEGLKLDMPVISYAGLLGKITEVSPHTAKVKLVTHPRFRMGALIQRTRHTGVVYGTASGECRMKYISLDADVKVGDIVETGGFSAQFPKGLLIGSIEAVWKEPGQIYRSASIRLAADFDRLEEVLCVVP